MKKKRFCKKILFVDKIQFGNLTDTLKYCEYLNSQFEITYLCYDRNTPKTVIKGVRVVYVPFIKNRILRQIVYVGFFIKLALFFDGFIFIVYHSGCRILKYILPWKKMHLDIRTLSVIPDDISRERQDNDLIKAVKIFNSVSAISTGIIEKLRKQSNKDIRFLPLGADIISSNKKAFKSLSLLYVGTLNNRHIIDTVKAVHRMIINNPSLEIQYDIVGDGEELCEITHYLEKEGLSSYIKLWGRIKHQDLKTFFDKCNIGVSYIPIEDYYQLQPPTKTFEYVFSGLYVIATKTVENSKIINNFNGILIDDNVDSFYNALIYITRNLKDIDSDVIRQSLNQYSWSNIIKTFLIPILEKP